MAPRVFVLPLLVAAVASIPVAARAAPPDTDTGHALGFGLGYARYAVLDEAATSLPYHAHLVTGALGYVGESRRFRWALRLGTGFGHLEATNHPGRAIRFVEAEGDGAQDVVVVPMRGVLHAPSGELSLERRVAFDSVSLLVGGAARFEVVYAQGFTTPGLMQLASLRPSVVLRRRLDSRQTIELGARTTVFGYMTRLPYHQSVSAPNTTAYRGLVRQGSGPRSMNRLQTLEIEASYELAFGAHGAARAALGLDFLHDTDPRPLRSLTSRAALAIFYRF